MQDRISATSRRTIIRITTNYDPEYVCPRLKKFADLYNYALAENCDKSLRDIIQEEKERLDIIFIRKEAAKRNKKKKVKRNVENPLSS